MTWVKIRLVQEGSLVVNLYDHYDAIPNDDAIKRDMIALVASGEVKPRWVEGLRVEELERFDDERIVELIQDAP